MAEQLSPEERIARMLKAIEDCKQAAKETEERFQNRRKQSYLAAADLVEILDVLTGLPVEVEYKSDDQTPGMVRCVVDIYRRFLKPLSPVVIVEVKAMRLARGYEPKVLMAFHVTAPEDPTGAAVLEHDGTVITPDQALDLATAAVEAVFKP